MRENENSKVRPRSMRTHESSKSIISPTSYDEHPKFGHDILENCRKEYALVKNNVLSINPCKKNLKHAKRDFHFKICHRPS